MRARRRARLQLQRHHGGHHKRLCTLPDAAATHAAATHAAAAHAADTHADAALDAAALVAVRAVLAYRAGNGTEQVRYSV